MDDNSTINRAVLLLTAGLSVERVEEECRKLGVSAEEASRIVSAGRHRITVAADYKLSEELGKAMMQLNDLYGRSIKGQDPKTALQARREMNRLLNLYACAAKPTSDAAQQQKEPTGRTANHDALLDAIDQCLGPLDLVPDDPEGVPAGYEELVRAAGQEIFSLRERSSACEEPSAEAEVV